MALRQSIRWRSLVHGGLEELRIDVGQDSIRVRAAVIGQAGAIPCGVLYEASLRPNWLLESIRLQRTDGVTSVLRREAGGHWFDRQAEAIPALEGCIDIDFEMTPFTNTLPIRRDPPEIGETRRYRVAYIPAETLEPFPVDQIYTRLADRLFRFETADGSFRADIAVDRDGLVLDYPGLFERVSRELPAA